MSNTRDMLEVVKINDEEYQLVAVRNVEVNFNATEITLIKGSATTIIRAKDMLERGDIVVIPIELCNLGEIMPGMLLKQDPTELERVRAESIMIHQERFSATIGMDAQYKLREFTIIQSRLIAKGYIIDDVNRDMMSLDIINSSDTETVDIFMKYLELYNVIEDNAKTYKTYEEIMGQLQAACEVEEIIEIIQKT